MSNFAAEFGKAKAVAAFLVTELGAVAIFFAGNARISGYIAMATALLASAAVYVVPNPIVGPTLVLPAPAVHMPAEGGAL